MENSSKILHQQLICNCDTITFQEWSIGWFPIHSIKKATSTLNQYTYVLLVSYPLAHPTSQASSCQPRDPNKGEHPTKKRDMNTKWVNANSDDKEAISRINHNHQFECILSQLNPSPGLRSYLKHDENNVIVKRKKANGTDDKIILEI